MKACVLHGIGDLRCETVPDPAPKPGEALIHVGACGVCGSDIPRIFKKGTYRFPLIPGHEFAGEIIAVGPGVTPGRIGERVAVFPLIPCKNCPACRGGAYAQCADYDYLGSRSDGAFAELVCAPEWNLIPVPENLSWEEAAMVEPAAVALHALYQGKLVLGDRIAIFGAGPIGLMLASWARAWGAAEVLLIDVDPARLDFARSLGFDGVCHAGETDPATWVHARTGRGADLVIEGSGSSAALDPCMKSARAFGRVVLMGNPASDMRLSQEGYWAILRKELTVSGTWNSVYADLPHNEWMLSLENMAKGTIDVKPLITHRVNLEELGGALVMLRDRTAPANKVICMPGKETP